MAFEFELRDLSFVPRWSVVRLLRGQNVAEHQFYTAIYAIQIMDLIEAELTKVSNGVLHLPYSETLRREVICYALVHDLEESFVGDIPGPVKRVISQNDDLDNLIEAEIEVRFPSLIQYTMPEHHLTINVVKIASLMDEVMLMIQEWRMGNRLLFKVEQNSVNRLEAAWRSLPWTDEVLSKIWATEIMPAIKRAKSKELRYITG